MKNCLIETSKESSVHKKSEQQINERVKLSKIEVKENMNSTFESGSYRVINFDYDFLYKDYRVIIEQVKNCLKEFCKDVKKVLVVGLGNKEVVCDSLGSRTVDKILLLGKDNDFETNTIINGILPNVAGVTGIESFDIVVGVSKQINPDLIICIDTLSAGIYENLFNSIQISNTSIVPGSGVKNPRKVLSEKTLGKPILIMGIPMLISVKNLLNSFVENDVNLKEENVWLSPKDVDFAVQEFSYILSKSINEFFYPEIKSSQIEKYIKGIF
ncbi:MAG: GPR endopeptidase [Clostridia bacterium]|nr:GPR endopeptidase [Clostridia bacterium]